MTEEPQGQGTAPAADCAMNPEQLPHGASNLAQRLDWFRNHLDRCSDAVYHEFSVGSVACALIFMQGMFNEKLIVNELLPALLQRTPDSPEELARDWFEARTLPIANSSVVTKLEDGLNVIMNAHGLLLMDGDYRMLELPYSFLEKRAVEEAPNESVIRGSREAFVESLDTNITLLRRRIRSSKLKTEKLLIGTQSQTTVILTYLDNVCPTALVAEVKRRLSYLKIDAVLGSSYLEEAIVDNPYSPFPQIQYTERPDTVSAAILEGRVAMLVDNTPIALMAPVTIFMLIQSAEDYYQPYIAASWIRWIRMLFMIMSLTLPSLYVAVTTFHPEMMPFSLLISVSSSRELVPFPTLLEAFVMEIAFEALREASVRIPKSIGQAVSIIGALIIGTAAVQAGIASAAMVIIVSITGIASFIIPNFSLGLSFRLLRFPIMLLAGFLGIFGIACGLICIYIHMLNLNSFGTPYLAPMAPLTQDGLKDTVYRSPWWAMRKRPFTASSNNKNRQSGNIRGWVKRREVDGD